ncbi:MAG: DUF45 domain-containing protein, partial [Propionibacteriaceae bacterium]|nr:DUF45 domain-containing protein [Propionibacteriaceae bacterium]
MSSPRSQEITVAGIPVTVRYGDVVRLRITVRPGDGAVRVSAPRRMSERRVLEFVTAKADWIVAARRRLIPPDEPGVRVWGRLVGLDVRLAPGRAHASLDGDALVVTVPAPEQAAGAVAAWRKRALAAELPRLLALWEPRLGARA